MTVTDIEKAPRETIRSIWGTEAKVSRIQSCILEVLWCTDEAVCSEAFYINGLLIAGLDGSECKRRDVRRQTDEDRQHIKCRLILQNIPRTIDVNKSHTVKKLHAMNDVFTIYGLFTSITHNIYILEQDIISPVWHRKMLCKLVIGIPIQVVHRCILQETKFRALKIARHKLYTKLCSVEYMNQD